MIEQSASPPSRCNVKLLSDDPVEQDSFGSIQPIADAIKSLIDTEEGGKAIALEGTWGSGKSSVIKMLQKRVATDKNLALFLFDAWAHHRDPLHMSFLEELTEFLSLEGRGWIDAKDWTPTLETLKGKREKVEETTRRGLSKSGIVVASAALFAPIGAAIAVAILKGELPSIMWWTAAVCVFLAPFAAVLLYLLARSHWDSRLKHNPQLRTTEPRPRPGDFFSGSVDVKHTDATKTPEPSAIDFRRVFSGLMSSALRDAGSQRKFITVVDNLDRLEPDGARNVWATMHSLFTTGLGPRPEWEKRFWLVVPFDEETPQKLWGDNCSHYAPSSKSPVCKDSETPGEAGLGKMDGSTGDSLGSSFLEKTFQVRLRVPRPVLSDWRSFMLAQLKLALPGHVQEHDAIYRIYNIHSVPRDQPPTPREIKAFINRLVTLHLLWPDESGMPLVSQAGYVLVSDRIDKNGTEIRNNALAILQDLSCYDDGEPQKHLAALHFGVPVDRAMHVLIGKDIESSLVDGHSDELEKLLRIHGAEEICIGVVEDGRTSWMRGQSSNVATVARTFAQVNEVLSPQASGTIWQYLARTVMGIPTWGGFGFSVPDAEGIIEVLEHCRSELLEPVARSVLERLHEGVLADADTAETGMQARHGNKAAWVSGVVALVTYLEHHGLEKTIREYLRIPGNLSDLVGVCCALGATTPKSITEFFVRAAQRRGDDVVNYFAERLKNSVPDDNLRRGIRLLISMNPTWPWQKLVDSVAARRSNTPQPREQTWLVDVLQDARHFVASVEPAVSQQLRQPSLLCGILYRLKPAAGSTPADAAVLHLAILELDPSPVPNVPVAMQGHQFHMKLRNDPSSEPDVVDELSKLIRRYSCLPALLGSAEKTQDKRKLVALLIGKNPDLLDASAFAEHCELLQATIAPKEFRELAQSVDADGSLSAAVTERPFDLARGSLYLELLPRSVGPSHALATFIRAGLQTLGAQEWATALKGNGAGLDLAFAIHDGGMAVDLGQSFQDALNTHADGMLKESKLPERLQSRWGDLPKLLSGASRDIFWRNLGDTLKQASDSNLTPLLKLYGPGLRESKVLSDEADSVVRRLIPKVIERADAAELSAMAPLLEQDKDIFRRALPASVQDLVARIDTKISQKSTSDDPRKLLERIRSALHSWTSGGGGKKGGQHG